MPKEYVTRNSMNAGEVSKLVAFREDVQKYSSACLTIENGVPLVEGGVKKMPGTYFAGPTALGGAMFTGSIGGDSPGGYVFTDINHSLIRIVDASGTINTLALTSTDPVWIDNGGLSSAYGVIRDSAGNLYAADFPASVVWKIDTTLNVTRVAGDGTHGSTGDGGPATSCKMRQPAFLAFDPAGNLYVSDITSGTIGVTNIVRVINMQSTSITVFGQTVAPGNIQTVAGNRTRGFSGDTGPATSAAFDAPYGIAIDPAGNLYIADQINNRIRMVDPTGIINTIIGDGTGAFSGDGGAYGSAQVFQPLGLSISNGLLYIADTFNERIRVANLTTGTLTTNSISIPAGFIQTVAGVGTGAFSGDGGPAIAAEVQEPWQAILDATGSLYITDTSNFRVRLVTSAGIISTVAGDGTDAYSGDGGPATAAEIGFAIGLAVIPGTGGNTLTVTDVEFGTIRVGQTVTGVGVATGTTITGFVPTMTPLTTFYTVTRAMTGHGTGDWEFVGNQFRTHFEPVTTALSDLTFTPVTPFSIPSTATILGVAVSSVLVSQFPTTSVLSQASLWNSGGQIGTIKTPNTPFTTSLTPESYGGPADTWGFAPGTLTAAVLNDPTVGFAEAVVTDTSRVFIGEDFTMTVTYSITTMVSGGSPGGVGTYTVSIPQSISSEFLQTGSTGKSRLVPFQFSTAQGAVLEFSEGIIRIWEGASQGSWSLGLALQAPAAANNYNPATAYIAGNVALVGPYAAALFYTHVTSPIVGWIPNPSLGVLSIAAPYGTSFANVVPITFTTNGVDSLAVTVSGSSPNQGINIALANATAGNNTAAAIETAIRALGTLNAPGSNFVDLSGWTVTPDPIYFASPWITAPTIAPGWLVAVGFTASFVTQAVSANTSDQFPVLYTGAFNSAFWTASNASAQLPIELVTPYLEADLFMLDCSTQSADVLWVFHPSYPPAVIERLGANTWSYGLSLPGQQPGEPPYRGTLDVVRTGYSGLGQSVTAITKANPCVVTVSATTAVFAQGSRVYGNLIAGMVELNQGEFLVDNPILNGDGTFSFSLQDPNTGLDVDSTGYLAYVSGGFFVQVVALFAAPGDYPACGTLYQERLCVGGSNNNPVQMNGSVQGDFPDFICDPNQEDFAIQFTLVSTKLDQILNMVGTPNSLLLGSAGGVWVMTGTNGGSLSQTNVSAAKQTSMGVSPLQPQVLDGSAIFVSRSARIVLFLLFDFVSNQWSSNDLTRLNRNITLGPTQALSGIVQTAFQTEPYPIFWSVRNDGELLGLVFNRQDQVYAWFRVDMKARGGFVESAAVISGANQEDQLAVIVRRTVNGVTMRYVEYFMPQELFGQLANAFFVHSGLQWSGGPAVAITGITNANPPVVTAPAHGFTDGETVQITGVQGMTEINQGPTQAYTVAMATSNTFQLAGMDTTAFAAYTGGGTVAHVANQVTGLNYLLGNTVVAVGDGAVILQPTVVTSDTMDFPYYANLITIGIPYKYTVQPTNPVLSSQAATTRGMPQKLNRYTLSLYEAMGGQVGEDLKHLYDITYGPGTKAMQPMMTTGEFTRDMDCDWSEESTFYIVQDDPLPFTLRGIVFRMSANQD